MGAGLRPARRRLFLHLLGCEPQPLSRAAFGVTRPLPGGARWATAAFAALDKIIRVYKVAAESDTRSVGLLIGEFGDGDGQGGGVGAVSG